MIERIARLGKFRAVYLSPERYRERRARFLDSLARDGGFLNESGVERVVASDWRERFPPQSHWFRRVRRRPHYWAATCDHIDLIERALCSQVDTLLVLEDDARFISGFESAFIHVVSLLPANWMALQLNWNDVKLLDPFGPLQGTAGAGAGMMANLWSRRGMLRFYDHAQANRNRIIDACYDVLRSMEPEGFFRPSGQLLAQDHFSSGAS